MHAPTKQVPVSVSRSHPNVEAIRKTFKVIKDKQGRRTVTAVSQRPPVRERLRFPYKDLRLEDADYNTKEIEETRVSVFNRIAFPPLDISIEPKKERKKLARAWKAKAKAKSPMAGDLREKLEEARARTRKERGKAKTLEVQTDLGACSSMTKKGKGRKIKAVWRKKDPMDDLEDPMEGVTVYRVTVVEDSSDPEDSTTICMVGAGPSEAEDSESNPVETRSQKGRSSTCKAPKKVSKVTIPDPVSEEVHQITDPSSEEEGEGPVFEDSDSSDESVDEELEALKEIEKLTQEVAKQDHQIEQL